jgi:uncharacterized paraquat-inducible protein A
MPKVSLMTTTHMVRCDECGANWTIPCVRDQQHAQCPGCRAVYEHYWRKVHHGKGNRVVRPSEFVPVQKAG